MREKSGLTLVEILTVLAIIALLTGILIPAVTAVRTAAKEVKQKGQFATIDLALAAWKSDADLTGDYPPSFSGHPAVASSVYCGSQKLAEALMGQDLLGFHPKSDFRPDGAIPNPANLTQLLPLYTTNTLSARKKPFLDSGTDYAFTLNDLYPNNQLAALEGMDEHVLCDIYGKNKITLRDGSVIKAGSPILYFKADSTARFNDPARLDPQYPRDNQGNIYNCYDNDTIVKIKWAADNPNPSAATPPVFDENAFYKIIEDPKIRNMSSPYNPNSYILISAGADGTFGNCQPGPDGRYGTPDDIWTKGDDIVNFGN